MSCTRTSTQPAYLKYGQWLRTQTNGRNCAVLFAMYIDYWETYDASGVLVQRVEDTWASACAYPPDATWVAQTEAFMEPILVDARAAVLTEIVEGLAPNQRIRDISWQQRQEGPTGNVTVVEELRYWLDTFACPTGEEPPPWGQPPYDEPGLPGSCDYADSRECEAPNETWLALEVDSGGQPVIVDCDVAPYDYCHAPCDSTFGPPAASVRLPPGATPAQRKDAVDDLIRLHYPGLEATFAGLECPWPPPSGGGAGARIRSSVSEDAGSLFQATQAAAVELGLSEAFEYGAKIPAGQLRSFSEALTPDDTAVSYYPLPTRNPEILVTVEGETNLGRLASVYPAGIMVPASAIPGASGGVVTAQQAIQHVTNQWASEHPWLSFAPIPDLRLMVPSAVAAPRQHYVDHPGDGVLTTAAVVIPQEGNERRSMREILDEWLAIFPGTIVRQTSTGVIELVPRVGPDAPSGAAVTLTWGDLTGISDGEDDPSGVTNRCRVTSQGWEFTPNQALIAPSFVLVRAANGVTRAVLDGENVLPTDSREEHSIYDDLVFTGLTAPTAATVDVVIHAYGSWSPTTSSSFSLEGTATRQVTLAAGQAQDVTITHNSRSQNVTASFRLRRSADGGRITVSAPGGIPESAGNPFGRTWFAYVLDVDVTGTAWVRSNERVESEFGQTGTALPGAGGGDALAESRALFGERLAVINSNVFQLTNEQAQLVARSYVLANINPRTIRDVQQSEWNRYPVKFDHIGRYVDLPTGERAVIENRSYSDSFSSTHGVMASSFSASVTEIVIDTTTDWLLLDSGDFMQLDSGTLLEVS